MISVQYTNEQQTVAPKVMIYGASGIGKTPILATAPGVLIGSAERGLLSLNQLRVPYIEIDRYNTLIEYVRWVATSQEASHYFSHALDSLSEVAELILSERKRLNKDPRKAYGETADEVVALVKYFRDIPNRSTILIAKEEYEKDESTGMMIFRPNFPGHKLGNALPYYFDETFRMFMYPGTKQRVLATQSSFQYVARDRSGNLAEYEPPELTAVYKKILGYK